MFFKPLIKQFPCIVDKILITKFSLKNVIMYTFIALLRYRSISDQLKGGSSYAAEFFKSITISFVNIIGLMAALSSKSAKEIIQIINDIHEFIDKTIKEYDVIQVSVKFP